MKMRLIFLFLLLSLFLAAKAKPVVEKQAREIGAKFLNASMKMPSLNADALHLVKTYRCVTGEEAFFVFNTEKGFVIVAANDCATPILGYSNEGPFVVDDIPVQLQDYLNGFLRQIEHYVANDLTASETIAAQWDCVRATGRLNVNRPDREIHPLMNEKWGQGDPYNRYCPDDPVGSGNHVFTGCVATAMAQIMHYWRYPEHGQGSHSYTPSTHHEYGVQSVDFSAATYRWDQMPYKLSSESSEEEIDAVATLMYHCGVSVDMMYAPSGSGAFSYDVPQSLVQYFRYPEDLQLIRRQQDDAEWLASIKAYLDLYRPVYYSGYNPEVGHAFICDGYDQDDLLHFNWGWSGSSNGYFALNDIEYNRYNYAIVNIHAPSDPDQICQVIANANASSVGTVLGGGDYHRGDICTLTAQAFSGCKFRAWLEDGTIVWQEPEYTFLVVGDRHVEAFFDGDWTAQVEADRVEDQALHTQSAVVSWVNGSTASGDIHDEWPLLTSFVILDKEIKGVATDGNYIYTASYYPELDSMFCKFDFEGNLIEDFNIEGGSGVRSNLAFDGQYFYGMNSHALYCYDLANKILVDVIPSYSEGTFCTYDPDHDGFWLYSSDSFSLQLVNRNGEVLQVSPPLVNSIHEGVSGATYYRNAQGEPHLLVRIYGVSDMWVQDFDINANVLSEDMLLSYYSMSSFIGEYMGKTAFYISYFVPSTPRLSSVEVFELPLDLSQVQLHRIYRVEGVVGEQGPSSNPELIADRCFGSSYTDLAFDTLPAGTYTYGVSLLTDGMASEIHWSNPIEHINRFTVCANVNLEEGGTVTGQGMYWEGEVCTLTASANPQYIFTGWLKNGNVVSTDSIFSFSVTEDAAYVANFEWNMAEIGALVTPSETGTVTGQGSYEKGSVCTLTATPAPKYSFLEWRKNGVVVSTEAVFSFTVTEDAAYEARFEQTVFEIQVVTFPQGCGEVTGAGMYNKGDTVTLVVTPKSNYKFSRWTENGLFLSSETTYSFVASIDRVICANLLYNQGVDEHGNVVLSLHPNPANDRLVVECLQPVNRYELFTLTGILVYSKEVTEGEALELEIGVGNLSPGLYLIRITTDGYSWIEKFVKQ